MNNFKNKLKNILYIRKMTTKELCEKIGMSVQNLNMIYGRGSIETKWLVKMSEFLKVPMIYWFEEEDNLKASDKNIIHGNANHIVNGNNNKINLENCEQELKQAKEEINFLKSTIEIKDLLIKQLADFHKLNE